VDGPELFVAGTQEGAYGTFTIEEDGDWTYTSHSAHDEFQDGYYYADGFQVLAADGTPTYVVVEIQGTGSEPEMMGAHANPDFAFA
jgi:VCBS repeat-containing protein